MIFKKTYILQFYQRSKNKETIGYLTAFSPSNGIKRSYFQSFRLRNFIDQKPRIQLPDIIIFKRPMSCNTNSVRTNESIDECWLDGDLGFEKSVSLQSLELTHSVSSEEAAEKIFCWFGAMDILPGNPQTISESYTIQQRERLTLVKPFNSVKLTKSSLLERRAKKAPKLSGDFLISTHSS